MFRRKLTRKLLPIRGFDELALLAGEPPENVEEPTLPSMNSLVSMLLGFDIVALPNRRLLDLSTAKVITAKITECCQSKAPGC